MNCPDCNEKLNEAGYMPIDPGARIRVTHWNCPECGRRVNKGDVIPTGKACAECAAPETFNGSYYQIDHTAGCDAWVPCELIDVATQRVAAAEDAAADAGSPTPLLTALMGEVFRD